MKKDVNPFTELHKEFIKAGANMLLSSGQACVMYGIAAFSKDGDWIIHEDKKSFEAVIRVLAKKNAVYRFGAPLDIQWHKKGWTSHFEFMDAENFRMRIDICSRPPRISNINELWERSIIKDEMDLVDVESLIRLKETRRIRDYSIIGSLAEVCGFDKNISAIALEYIQDYERLKDAVERWPIESQKTERKAVKLLMNGAKRHEIVAEIAIEQDEKIQNDAKRVQRIIDKTKSLRGHFAKLKLKWQKEDVTLVNQHRMLLEAAQELLDE